MNEDLHKQFSNIFNKSILPMLKKNGFRKKITPDYSYLNPIGIVLAIFLVLLCLKMPIAILFLVLLIILSIPILPSFFVDYESKLEKRSYVAKALAMPYLLSIFGDLEYQKFLENTPSNPYVAKIKNFKVFNTSFLKVIDEMIIGNVDGVSIELFENYSLVDMEGTRNLTVVFKFPKNFSSNTIIVEKDYVRNNRSNNIKDLNLQKVELEDIVFNKDFLVYSDDQVDARYLLTTSFIKRFQEIKFLYKTPYIRAEFKDDELALCIGLTSDFFNCKFSNIEKAREAFYKMFKEIDSIVNLIEELKLNLKIGL